MRRHHAELGGGRARGQQRELLARQAVVADIARGVGQIGADRRLGARERERCRARAGDRYRCCRVGSGGGGAQHAGADRHLECQGQRAVAGAKRTGFARAREYQCAIDIGRDDDAARQHAHRRDHRWQLFLGIGQVGQRLLFVARIDRLDRHHQEALRGHLHALEQGGVDHEHRFACGNGDATLGLRQGVGETDERIARKQQPRGRCGRERPYGHHRLGGQCVEVAFGGTLGGAGLVACEHRKRNARLWRHRLFIDRIIRQNHRAFGDVARDRIHIPRRRPQAQRLPRPVLGAKRAGKEPRAGEEAGRHQREFADRALERKERLAIKQRQVGARAQRNAAACARLDAARLARTRGTRHNECTGRLDTDAAVQGREQVDREPLHGVALAVEVGEHQAAFVNFGAQPVDGGAKRIGRQCAQFEFARGDLRCVARVAGHHQRFRRGDLHPAACHRNDRAGIGQARGERRRRHPMNLDHTARIDLHAGAACDQRARLLLEASGNGQHNPPATGGGARIARHDVARHDQVAGIGHFALIVEPCPHIERDAARTRGNRHAVIDCSIRQHTQRAQVDQVHRAGRTGANRRLLEIPDRQRDAGRARAPRAQVGHRTQFERAHVVEPNVARRRDRRQPDHAGAKRQELLRHGGAGGCTRRCTRGGAGRSRRRGLLADARRRLQPQRLADQAQRTQMGAHIAHDRAR